MIIKNISNGFKQAEPGHLVSSKDLISLFDKRDEFKEDLMRVFRVNEDELEIFQIDNAKQLIQAVLEIDNKCDKIDIVTKLKDVHLVKMLEQEKAKFEIFDIKNDQIAKVIKSDKLDAESRYNAKHDILEEYHFSKFANYCRDNKYDDLIDKVEEYIRKNKSSTDLKIGLRFVYLKETGEFLIRSKTSESAYKDFGVNFSVFTAIVSIGRYAKESGYTIYVDNFRVDESTIYVSFQLSKVLKIADDLQMKINLTLENNEIGEGAVKFNGVCKLIYTNNGEESSIFIKPKGIKDKAKGYSVDLLTYAHRGKVDKVYEQLESLSHRITLFIDQVAEEAPRIVELSHTDDVKKLIARKVKYSQKEEFKQYKKPILDKLAKISVDSTFKLFELLGEVEQLFGHQDVISRDFWRQKLYEALIEGK